MKPKTFFIILFLIITSTFLLATSSTKIAPCANSISCIKNLTAEVDNDEAQGTFLGNIVTVPQINLSVDSTYPPTKNTYPTILGDEIDPAQKHIYVDLSKQKIYAFNDNQLYFETEVSTGRWGKTPVGEYKIWIKIRSQKMSGGSGSSYYYLPNVPYIMFFYNNQIPKSRGYGLHGAYWHNNFGHEMSHGCVNLRTTDAKILYDWASPTTVNLSTPATTKDPGTEISICNKIILNEGEKPQCINSTENSLPQESPETDLNNSDKETSQFPQTTTMSQDSPDGLIKLTLKVYESVINKTKYNLYVKKEDLDSGDEKLVFSENIANETNVEIPSNTWSPDNEYFFIKQYSNNSQKYLVFKATGDEISEKQYLDVNEYFIQEDTSYYLSEITGWASQNLLLVRTKEIESDEDGPSYWFNVTNQSFIWLSSRF